MYVIAPADITFPSGPCSDLYSDHLYEYLPPPRSSSQGDHRIIPSMFSKFPDYTNVPIRDPHPAVSSPRPHGRSTSSASVRFPTSPPTSPRFGPLYSPRAASSASASANMFARTKADAPPSSSSSSYSSSYPASTSTADKFPMSPPHSAVSPFTPYTPFYMRDTISAQKQVCGSSHSHSHS